jgi:hypothetical protein
VGEFLDAMAARGVTASSPALVAFETQRPPFVGVCLSSDAGGQVYIDPRLATNGPGLRAVLWHELAHCSLDLDHDPEPDHLVSAAVPGDLVAWDAARWAAELDRLAALVRREGR